MPVAVVALAFAVRAWSLGDQGLDHFDEGIGPENRVEVDARTLQRLRDLGYLR